LSGVIKQANTAVIFTNQLRQKIGVMFGNPETTTGGMALKFYASVRMDMRRIESIKVGQEVVGNRTRVRVVKNKVAPPFKVAEFDIMYNEGISKVGGVLDLGVELELISKRGSYYSYGEERLGQGRENAKTYLREHPELAEMLETKIRVAAGIEPLDESQVPDEYEVFEESQPAEQLEVALGD
jgi:recombination protein RecA